MKDLTHFMKSLEAFSPKQYENHIDITIPVVLYVDNFLLDLRIILNDSGFKIYCPNDLFSQANRSQEWYFNLFMVKDSNYHYDMQFDNGIVFKDFYDDSNIVVAVSDFIHFFVLWDDFIINNKVIGNEENF